MLDFSFCHVDEILMRRKSLRKELLATEGLKDLRIAILGGSTTNELANFLELLLLSNGFRPAFYQSEYGRFYEDAVQDSQALIDFAPDLVYIHTSYRDVRQRPSLGCTEEQFNASVSSEMGMFQEIWDSLQRNLGCQVIQSNFETPPYAILGNMDTVAYGGLSRFLLQMNVAFAQEAAKRTKLILQDVHGISARFGVQSWFDWNRFWNYKLLLKPEANLELARSLTSIVRAIFGKSRKVLVLDLDNTLWGGVIGDDGIEKIQIGRETPVAEAYTAFQEYCLSLRNRGVLLAVCSKNTEAVAKSGFEHPSSILKLEDISCFRANWNPKHQNIEEIAGELNLGVDSFVFVDDNPAERAIVQAQLPQVAVPDVGSEVSRFAEILERGRYFEPVALSKEDLARAALYADNSRRAAFQQKFANYGEYLDSLEMVAEIDNFRPLYLDRIAQLTNKTNQFNLTTRRYTLAEMEAIAADRRYIALYGKLSDRFGDNGLISVVLGRRELDELHMDLWLMSCRVLKRDMEAAMLDALVERARGVGIKCVVGRYLPTSKNAMVADFYPTLGFESIPVPQSDQSAGATVWKLDLAGYKQKNRHIRVTEYANA
jgi:FkbH-like protein